MLRLTSSFFIFTLLISYMGSADAHNGDGLHSRIVGGEEAGRDEFPFIVSLQSSEGHFCGGSLIKKDWVLTAAHCLGGGTPSQVVIGLYDRSDTRNTETFRPAQVIVHPRNNSATMDFDFALIRLDHESKYAPVALGRAELEGTIDLVTAGWGAIEQGSDLSERLLKVTVPFVNNIGCSKAYPGQITDTMICAGLDQGGKDSCQGDSGGPLLMGAGAQRTLVGVVSWGEGCAQPNKFGVYGKVSAVLPWVDSVIQ